MFLVTRWTEFVTHWEPWFQWCNFQPIDEATGARKSWQYNHLTSKWLTVTAKILGYEISAVSITTAVFWNVKSCSMIDNVSEKPATAVFRMQVDWRLWYGMTSQPECRYINNIRVKLIHAYLRDYICNELLIASVPVQLKAIHQANNKQIQCKTRQHAYFHWW